MKKNASHIEIRECLCILPEKISEIKQYLHYDKLKWYDWMKILRYQPSLIEHCSYISVPARMLYTLLQHQPQLFSHFKPIPFELSETYMYLYNSSNDRRWTVYSISDAEKVLPFIEKDILIANFFGFEDIKYELEKIKLNIFA
jgi:hypothetical protein